MINIILCILLIVLCSTNIYFIRQYNAIKKAFDEVLINIMKNHENYINTQKSIIKEFKTRIDDIGKVNKDINTIRNNYKSLLDEMRIRSRSLTDRDK